MYGLKMRAKKELEEFGKRELSVRDLEPICMLMKIYKGASEIIEEEEEESWSKGGHMRPVEKGYDPYHKKDEKVHEDLTQEELKMWAEGMENEDGTSGAHWTMEQTSAVAKQHGIVFDHVTDMEWCVIMNAMYSDYCKTAKKYNVDKPDFYADLAKDFLFDKDSVHPKQKVAAYYHTIVKPAM